MVGAYMKLKEKICIITGGARGIGKEICSYFLSEGAVVCIFDLNKTDALNTLDQFEKKYGKEKAAFFHIDVTSVESVENGIEEIIKKSLQNKTPLIKAGPRKEIPTPESRYRA